MRLHARCCCCCCRCCRCCCCCRYCRCCRCWNLWTVAFETCYKLRVSYKQYPMVHFACSRRIRMAAGQPRRHSQQPPSMRQQHLLALLTQTLQTGLLLPASHSQPAYDDDEKRFTQDSQETMTNLTHQVLAPLLGVDLWSQNLLPSFSSFSFIQPRVLRFLAVMQTLTVLQATAERELFDSNF
jgi:hypothetical protein